ncbi:hypothetical protein C7212DRAFT_361036 [Tuber magnatum]|uniref:Uncharacterized protein n=1 Tax=Tuber magnatum TaxID=42249 RepID=A0A317SZV4_9PEZI|nr:hypothetical protein C7212DRAFT_361036 [Tuber magnatum]
MAYGAKTLPQWHGYYEAEAQNFLAQCYLPPNAVEIRRSLLNDHLKAYAQTTISSGAQALQNSGTWASVVQGTAAAGAVPMGKVLVKSGGALFFASGALKSFGLNGDMEAELFDIALRAKLIETNPEKILESQVKEKLKKAIESGAKDFWEKENMADHIKDELKEEFKDEVAVEAIEEFVHLIPVLGQIWSYGVGYYRAEKKLNKVLDMVTKRAHEVHIEVVIPLICYSLVRDQPPPPPIPHTLILPSFREVKTKTPSLPETKPSRPRAAPVLTRNTMTKPPVSRKQTSFLVGLSRLPSPSGFQNLLMLLLFSATIYIFEPAPVLVLLFWIMVFWCIFSALYYFRRAIFLTAGLVIVVVLAMLTWEQVAANYVFSSAKVLSSFIGAACGKLFSPVIQAELVQ